MFGADSDHPLDLLAAAIDRESSATIVHRLGHKDGPFDYVPRSICSWLNRWDDPEREYRTLYCATTSATCLREALADLRPDAKVMAEMEQLYGPDFDIRAAAGTVADPWFSSHELVQARLHCEGPIVDVDDLGLRERLTRKHAHFFRLAGVKHLDVGILRGSSRVITQTVSRSLWEAGAAGIHTARRSMIKVAMRSLKAEPV